MTEKRIVWTEEDVGCYIDGGLGPEHGMVRLLSLMQETGTCGSHLTWPKDLAARLETANQDELSDDDLELDDATDYLQEHTEEGLVWVWGLMCPGDLVLARASDLEESEGD